MANTRVKVRREVLIEKLTAERDRIVAEHTEAVSDAKVQERAFRNALDNALRVFLDDLKSKPEQAMARVDGYYRRGGSRGTEVKFPHVEPPPELSDEPNTHKLDRMLAVLRSAEDETLSISAQDEYARFL